MIVKMILTDGTLEMFETGNYKISKLKDFHPLICKVTVFSNNGKKIKSVKRPFSFFYKHFTFKSAKVQEELKKLEQQRISEQEVKQNEG